MKPRRATSTDIITQKSGQSQISVRETSGWTSTGRTSRDEGDEDLGLRENSSDLVVDLQETGKTSIRSGITSSHLAFCPSRPLCCGSPPSDHLRHPTGVAANQPTLARIGTQKQSREGRETHRNSLLLGLLALLLELLLELLGLLLSLDLKVVGVLAGLLGFLLGLLLELGRSGVDVLGYLGGFGLVRFRKGRGSIRVSEGCLREVDGRSRRNVPPCSAPIREKDIHPVSPLIQLQR
jgi:hypothetical protein